MPSSVVPWLDGASPMSWCTFAAPPRKRRYQRGIMPPWDHPTMSTCVARVEALLELMDKLLRERS